MKLTKVKAVWFGAMGICIVLAGIGVEVTMKTDIGFVLITAGSVAVAGGCVLFRLV